MKKLFFMAMAAAAVSLASCGGRTAQTAEPDSLACDTTECSKAECPKDAAGQVVAQLTEQLQQADPEQLQNIANTISETVSELIAQGKTEAAERYTAIINAFVAENAARLQEIGASETVTSALAAGTAAIEQGTEAARAAKAAAEGAPEAIEAAKAAVEAAPEAVKEAAKAKAEELKEDAKQQATDAANKAIDDAAAAAKKKLGL